GRGDGGLRARSQTREVAARVPGQPAEVGGASGLRKTTLRGFGPAGRDGERAFGNGRAARRVVLNGSRRLAGCGPRPLRCSSVKYVQYSPSSRLAAGAPRSARLGPPFNTSLLVWKPHRDTTWTRAPTRDTTPVPG